MPVVCLLAIDVALQLAPNGFWTLLLHTHTLVACSFCTVVYSATFLQTCADDLASWCLCGTGKVTLPRHADRACICTFSFSLPCTLPSCNWHHQNTYGVASIFYSSASFFTRIPSTDQTQDGQNKEDKKRSRMRGRESFFTVLPVLIGHRHTRSISLGAEKGVDICLGFFSFSS